MMLAGSPCTLGASTRAGVRESRVSTTTTRRAGHHQVVVVAHAGGQEEAVLSRRQHVLAGLALGAGLSAQQGSRARAEGTPPPPPAPATLVPYADPIDKFCLSVPSDWVLAEGSTNAATSNGTRRTVAWFPKDGVARDLNVSVLVTNVSFEFTQLGSFGSAAAFGQNLVNSLDRSQLLKEQERTGKPSKDPIQLAKLVDYDSKRGQYQVEYTVQMLPDEPRHLFSSVALGNNGKYNRLYTVTAQCDESDVKKYKGMLEAIIKTFKNDVAAKSA